LYIVKLKLKLIIIAFLETINRLQNTSGTEHKVHGWCCVKLHFAAHVAETSVFA